MSADTTTSSKDSMDCDRVAREEIVEGYLVGRLGEEERDAFEQHYFECARCFDELRTLQAIREELRAAPEFVAKARPPLLRWAPAAGLAAAIVLAVGVALWMRPVPAGVSETTNLEPARAERPELPQPRESKPIAAPEPSLEQLARVEAPRYDPLTLRGVPSDATARFQRGMEHYRKADYGAAVDDLRTAAELDPNAAHIRFFLGVSHLMLGQDDAAIDGLRSTIALGDSAYLEEAHWYLAKAFLRRKDLRAAEAQLKKLVELRGSMSGEARRLLTHLERLKDRSR